MLIPTQTAPAAVLGMVPARQLAAVEPEPLRVVYLGLRSVCVAYVVHENQVLLLSLAGTATVNNGLWAALVSNEMLEITEPPSRWVRRVPATDPGEKVETLARRKMPSDYKSYRKRLPETGKQHMAIVHRQATGECAMDRDFFVLGDNDRAEPPFERFFRQFTQAVACAARPDWTPYLWHEGLANDQIVPCPSHGLCAWRVSAAATRWQELVKRGLNNRDLS